MLPTLALLLEACGNGMPKLRGVLWVSLWKSGAQAGIGTGNLRGQRGPCDEPHLLEDIALVCDVQGLAGIRGGLRIPPLLPAPGAAVLVRLLTVLAGEVEPRVGGPEGRPLIKSAAGTQRPLVPLGLTIRTPALVREVSKPVACRVSSSEWDAADRRGHRGDPQCHQPHAVGRAGPGCAQGLHGTPPAAGSGHREGEGRGAVSWSAGGHEAARGYQAHAGPWHGMVPGLRSNRGESLDAVQDHEGGAGRCLVRRIRTRIGV